MRWIELEVSFPGDRQRRENDLPWSHAISRHVGGSL